MEIRPAPRSADDILLQTAYAERASVSTPTLRLNLWLQDHGTGNGACTPNARTQRRRTCSSCRRRPCRSKVEENESSPRNGDIDIRTTQDLTGALGNDGACEGAPCATDPPLTDPPVTRTDYPAESLLLWRQADGNNNSNHYAYYTIKFFRNQVLCSGEGSPAESYGWQASC